MCVWCCKCSYLYTKIKLRIVWLANNNDVNLIDSFKWVLAQYISDIMIGSTHLFHMIRHIKVKVFSCRILNFECMEQTFVIFCFNWNICVVNPFSWHIIFYWFFSSLWHQWTLLCRGFIYEFSLLVVDANIRVVSFPIDIQIQSVQWIWVIDLIDTCTILFELNEFFLWILLKNILAVDVLLWHWGIDISLSTDLCESWD